MNHNSPKFISSSFHIINELNKPKEKKEEVITLHLDIFFNNINSELDNLLPTLPFQPRKKSKGFNIQNYLPSLQSLFKDDIQDQEKEQLDSE